MRYYALLMNLSVVGGMMLIVAIIFFKDGVKKAFKDDTEDFWHE